MKRNAIIFIVIMFFPVLLVAQGEKNIDTYIIQGKQLVQETLKTWSESDMLKARAFFERLLTDTTYPWLIHYYIGFADDRLVSYYLSVDDYQNNHNDIFISPFKYQSSSDTNIIAKIHNNSVNNNSINVINNTICEYPARVYFGPTDLTKLHIRLYDIFGRVINYNIDYSMELLCELIYENP